MEPIQYELINDRIELTKIRSDFFDNNKAYYTIIKNSKGDQIYFFNPEFSFEKQMVINADINIVLDYLKIQEKHPEQYKQFLQNGFVYIRIDYSHLSIFVMHTMK